MSDETVTCPGCADLAAQNRALAAELERWRFYRTLGGPPPVPMQRWENRHIEPPDSARVAPWEER